MQLAMIGLGRMGGNMARRLAQGGHELIVYDQNAQAVKGHIGKRGVSIVDGRDAGVHLRFIVGAAVAASAVNLVADDNVGRWGLPLTRLLGRALAHESVTLLILPQAPKRLAVALQRGRAAQREVSAQLFASNAIRNFRASVGEPVAVISAHPAPMTDSVGRSSESLKIVVRGRR